MVLSSFCRFNVSFLGFLVTFVRFDENQQFVLETFAPELVTLAIAFKFSYMIDFIIAGIYNKAWMVLILAIFLSHCNSISINWGKYMRQYFRSLLKAVFFYSCKYLLLFIVLVFRIM